MPARVVREEAGDWKSRTMGPADNLANVASRPQYATGQQLSSELTTGSKVGCADQGERKSKTEANIESNGVGTHPGHVLIRGVCGI